MLLLTRRALSPHYPNRSINLRRILDDWQASHSPRRPNSMAFMLIFAYQLVSVITRAARMDRRPAGAESELLSGSSVIVSAPQPWRLRESHVVRQRPS